MVDVNGSLSGSLSELSLSSQKKVEEEYSNDGTKSFVLSGIDIDPHASKKVSLFITSQIFWTVRLSV